jgi:hypothetical protein
MHWINSDNKIQEGNVESLLFKWNIKSKSMNLLPENNYNWTYLKQYLREKLGWEWVINAKIILDDDNNTIAVKHDLTSNHAIVYINLREKRASVRYDGENLDIFKVIEQEDTLLISKTLSTIKELRNNGFKNGFYRLLVLLILNINLNYSGEPENSSIKKAQILGNDKEFVQVTQKIIKILQESIKQ